MGGCSNCARGLQAWHAVVRCEGVRACGAASVRRREFRGRRHRHKPRRLEDGAKPRRANSWKRANLQSLTDKPAGGSTARSLRLAARNGHTTMRRRAAEDRKGARRHDGRLATNVCCRCIAPLKTRLPPSQARASSSASIVDFVSCPLKLREKYPKILVVQPYIQHVEQPYQPTPAGSGPFALRQRDGYAEA